VSKDNFLQYLLSGRILRNLGEFCCGIGGKLNLATAETTSQFFCKKKVPV
jgi:hypothetical protein